MGFTDFLHNLTKTGVYDPKSGETYYSDADKALNAFGSAVSDYADKSADFQKNIGPEFAGDQPPAEPAFLGKPTFAEASDVMNPRRHQMLTKGGALVSILKGGLEGGLAGQAANAEVYARTGRSGGVGVGLGAGFEAPLQQAAERQAVQHGNLENQELQGRVNLLPWQVAVHQANLHKLQADTAHANAQTERARYQLPRGGGIFDTATGRYIAQPPTPYHNSPESRFAFAQQHPELFDSSKDDDVRDFIRYGTKPHQMQDTEWSLRLMASQGNEDAQAALDQHFSEQKDLAHIRGSNSQNNRSAKEQEAGDAEDIAAQIMNSVNGDPDKALAKLDQLAPNVTDPYQKRIGPQVRSAIRARRHVNTPVNPRQQFEDELWRGINQTNGTQRPQ